MSKIKSPNFLNIYTLLLEYLRFVTIDQIGEELDPANNTEFLDYLSSKYQITVSEKVERIYDYGWCIAKRFDLGWTHICKKCGKETKVYYSDNVTPGFCSHCGYSIESLENE